MEVTQIADIVNGVSSEILGEGAIQTEDLSNVVDMGKQIFSNTSYDRFVKSLIDHIGKVMFVSRTYTGSTLALRRDGWEYGAVMEKITETELPEAVENEAWNLTDGASYDPNVFNKPAVAAKFYNKRTVFEIDRSIADMQARSAFSSATQLNAFVSMLFNVDYKFCARILLCADNVFVQGRYFLAILQWNLNQVCIFCLLDKHTCVA